MHEKVKNRNGPHTFAKDQLKLKHKAEKMIENERIAPLLAQISLLNRDDPMRDELFDRYITESGEFRRRQSNEIAALLRQQRAEIVRNGGINPDQAQIDRKDMDTVIKQWQHIRRRILHYPNINWNNTVDDYRRRIEHIINLNRVGAENIQRLRDHLAFVAEDHRQLLETVNRVRAQAPIGRAQAIRAQGEAAHQEAVARAAGPNPNENLAAFARDKQNVHTQKAVEQVKHNIEVIRKIFVPPEYRWNPTKISKTYREIVYDCDLSPKGNWQFASYYCNNATIYDMEPGIFGIMTDGVWQFIRDSEDKRCLINILKREFEDNVGMCAQGNLSRVCNILSGYLPGIGQSESVATILGREFPKLMDIEDEAARITEAQRILRENNVLEAEWESWLEPLRS